MIVLSEVVYFLLCYDILVGVRCVIFFLCVLGVMFDFVCLGSYLLIMFIDVFFKYIGFINGVIVKVLGVISVSLLDKRCYLCFINV